MGKHLSMDDKQLIIQLHVRGFTQHLISDQLNCCKKTISTIITNWRRGKIAGRCKTKRRAYKLSAQKTFLILNYFIENPFNTHKQCIKDLNMSLSSNTIRRVLQGDGIKSYVACPKPFLSMRNQIKRLRFAMNVRGWTSEQWANVVYIDEKTVQTFSNGKVLVKRRKNERYNVDKLITQEVQNKHNKVNLVGVIHFDGPNMIYSVHTKLKGSHFNQLMRTKVEPILKHKTILIDNAKIHLKAINYLRQNLVNVLDFPPKSPDLNPIENVWAELQKILNKKLKSTTISTKNDLIELIRVSWKEISPQTINNCILSMPRRVHEVIRAEGKQTRY